MKIQPCVIILSIVMLFVVYRMATIQYEETEMEATSHPFDTILDSGTSEPRVGYLPHGIVHSRSDMEVKPLWLAKGSKERNQSYRNLLAMPVGIKQKNNVDIIVTKFLSENFTVILFHYDGNVNEWNEFWWSKNVIHIAANDQTKWWFAKRFLHPDVVSIYDYIFLWDEDLGVDNFHPGRYLKIMKLESLEISQPALDPQLSEVHHRLTARRKKGRVHRRVYGSQGRRKCTSKGPPCAGWVEGMAPVFSRSAWRCAWHLIQNDLIHGWGMDMKLGYCAQGDRTRNVGIIDSEFVVHQGVQTLGMSSNKHRTGRGTLDARVEVRRRARSELECFQERWDRATREDEGWVDPFLHDQRKDKKHARIL
ncbi:uncharacterized protein LOC109834210 isoform X2 [Asparagus officinalis]|uniref:uncharacterized protein LOC109834210 isoform X2 n=1 Tax=Asparagus officinalis TaxID=4686 RepID=UPI00098E7332|nr:uncharacterized protein LOC109834210 isoform X2 [Asparagus officinalis]